MPVTFAPGWVPPPSTGASVFGGIASGIQNALETYRTFKKDKEDHDFRVQEMALRSQEAEARRAEQAQRAQIFQHQLEREQTEEGIQTEAERAALGVVGQQQKEIGDLGALVSEATKTGFVAPQIQTQQPTIGDVMKSIKKDNPKVPVPTLPALETPPQGALASMISPNAFTQPQPAPLQSMVAPQITAPEIAPAPTAAAKLAVNEQAAQQAAAAPSGPLSIAQRAAGRKAISDQTFQREVGEKERTERVAHERQLESERIGDERQMAGIKAAAELQEKSNKAAFERAELAAAKARAAQDKRDQNTQFNQEKTIRTGWEQTRRKPQENLATMERYAGSVNEKIRKGERPSAADQYGLVYAFNKALDPTSVVRESEFQNTTKVAANYVDRAYRYFKQITAGEMLTDRQISEMMDVINEGRNKAKAEVDDVDNRYYSMALNNQLNPDRIFGSQHAATGAAAAAGASDKGKTGEAKPHDPLGLY